MSPSVREMILVLNDDAVLNGWRRLPQELNSDAAAFAAANGQSFFQYIASNQERSALMGGFMTEIYGSEGAKIASSVPFARFGSLLDVGEAKVIFLSIYCSGIPAFEERYSIFRRRPKLPASF